MSSRIDFLRERLQKYKEELEKAIEEENIMNEIMEVRKKIIEVKSKRTSIKKSYSDLKREEVMRELEKCDYREIMSDTGRVYYVTSDGDFYSETKRLKKGNTTGYEYVSIDGKLKLVHRLVWEAFNGKIPAGMEIDHINTDRLDNRLENLRVVTPSENKRNPITIEHYKESNKNKGAVRKRIEKKLSENLFF